MLPTLAAIPDSAWLLLAPIIGGCVLAMLHTLACVARNERAVHDIRRRVVELRNHYAEQLDELERRNSGDANVDVLPDAPPVAGEPDEIEVVGPASPAKAA